MQKQLIYKNISVTNCLFIFIFSCLNLVPCMALLLSPSCGCSHHSFCHCLHVCSGAATAISITPMPLPPPPLSPNIPFCIYILTTSPVSIITLVPFQHGQLHPYSTTISVIFIVLYIHHHDHCPHTSSTAIFSGSHHTSVSIFLNVFGCIHTCSTTVVSVLSEPP